MRFLFLFLLLSNLSFASISFAQETSSSDDDPFGDSSEPTDISAEKGLEWRRSENLYIARGNARAIRGKITADAEILMAFYDQTGKKLQRLVGQNNVVLTSGNTVMTGEFGDYDVIKKFLRLTGQGLSIKTQKDTITASKAIDYWTGDKIIKTRGDSKIISGDTTITSNESTIFLHKDGPNKGKAFQVQSDGNVKVVTSKQIATAQHLVHNVDKDITVLTGNVVILEGDRRVEGPKAEIDHKSGISRIISDGSRVKVNINPKNPTNKSPNQPKPAAP